MRIDHRSYEAQGIEQIPTAHEGPLVQKIEKRGIRTLKGDLNRWIKATNRLLAGLKKKIHSLLDWIASIKKEMEEAKQQEPYLIEFIGQYYRNRNQGAWSNKAKTQNLKKFMAAYNFLQANDLHTVEQLEERIRELSLETGTLFKRMNSLSAHEKKLKEMILFGGNVQRLQPIIDEMNGIHWKGKRDKFRSDHQEEINLYYTSRRILKQNHGVNEVHIPTWQKEQETLRQQQEEINDHYKELREKLKQLQNVRYCVNMTKKAMEPVQQIKDKPQVR